MKSTPALFASRLAQVLVVLAAPALVAVGCHASAKVQTAPPPAPSSAEPVASAPPPPVDTDGDGIPDVDDKCPNEKGVVHEKHPERNGCPKLGRVRMAATKVEITEKIMFASGAAKIEASSDSLLQEIAEILTKEGGQIDLIEVAGHADKNGDAAYNLKLTQERSAAVVAALVKLGVPAAKLRAKGYGWYCPLDAKDDEKNRRVEFTIVKMNGKPTGVALGCEAATKAGVKPDPVN
jgi:outer membrane protein OmpA-like peptidoglycan-associated protein